MVFGGFVFVGGYFDVIIKVLFFEMMMIGGVVVGVFLIGNKLKMVIKMFGDFVKIFVGVKWKV